MTNQEIKDWFHKNLDMERLSQRRVSAGYWRIINGVISLEEEDVYCIHHKRTKFGYRLMVTKVDIYDSRLLASARILANFGKEMDNWLDSDQIKFLFLMSDLMDEVFEPTKENY